MCCNIFARAVADADFCCGAVIVVLTDPGGLPHDVRWAGGGCNRAALDINQTAADGASTPAALAAVTLGQRFGAWNLCQVVMVLVVTDGTCSQQLQCWCAATH